MNINTRTLLRTTAWHSPHISGTLTIPAFFKNTVYLLKLNIHMTITLIWNTFTVISILSGKQSNLVGLSHFCKTVRIQN